MKIRNGFASNSSSSSFIIRKEFLNKGQIYLIKKHMETYKELDIDFGYALSESDEWFIDESEEEISGSTSMNNFYMEDYFEAIGVDSVFVEWDN